MITPLQRRLLNKYYEFLLWMAIIHAETVRHLI